MVPFVDLMLRLDNMCYIVHYIIRSILYVSTVWGLVLGPDPLVWGPYQVPLVFGNSRIGMLIVFEIWYVVYDIY